MVSRSQVAVCEVNKWHFESSTVDHKEGGDPERWWYWGYHRL